MATDTATMKAIAVRATGGVELLEEVSVGALNALTVHSITHTLPHSLTPRCLCACVCQVELPVPTPEGRQLLVKVAAVSMNPVDCKARDGFGSHGPIDGPPRGVCWGVSLCGSRLADGAAW